MHVVPFHHQPPNINPRCFTEDEACIVLPGTAPLMPHLPLWGTPKTRLGMRGQAENNRGWSQTQMTELGAMQGQRNPKATSHSHYAWQPPDIFFYIPLLLNQWHHVVLFVILHTKPLFCRFLTGDYLIVVPAYMFGCVFYSQRCRTERYWAKKRRKCVKLNYTYSSNRMPTWKSCTTFKFPFCRKGMAIFGLLK